MDSESDYSSEGGGHRATSLDDPRLPGAEPSYPEDDRMQAEENFTGRQPPRQRHDDNRYPPRQIYLPNDDGPLNESKNSVVFLNQMFEMMKQPLIIAVVVLIFESNPVRNFAIRSLPIGVSFEGQLDFIGLLVLALLAGITVSLATKFIDKQLLL